MFCYLIRKRLWKIIKFFDKVIENVILDSNWFLLNYDNLRVEIFNIFEFLSDYWCNF